MENFSVDLIVILGAILVFVLLRVFWLWYFGIHKRIDYMAEQTAILKWIASRQDPDRFMDFYQAWRREYYGKSAKKPIKKNRQ